MASDETTDPKKGNESSNEEIVNKMEEEAVEEEAVEETNADDADDKAANSTKDLDETSNVNEEDEKEEKSNQENGDGDDNDSLNMSMNGEDDDDHRNDDDDDDNESTATTQTNESLARDETTTSDAFKSGDFPSHIPDHLDRSTINGIRKYLEGFEANDELDDDEIVNLMTKVDRNVEHRTRYYTNPLDDIVDEEKMQEEFHREEEEHLVGHDFMKDLTTTLQAKKRRVDKRTVNWVKRAAGLNRKDYHSPHSALGRDDNDSDVNEETRKIAPRRYTRGMARSTRIKKKEEFIFKDNLGLRSLLDVIEDMEEESGPYLVPFECSKSREKSRHSDRKRPAPSSRISDDESRKPTKRRDLAAITRPLVARLSEEAIIEGNARSGDDFIFGDTRDILVIRVLVNGEHVEEDDVDKMSMRERKLELKRLRDRQYQKRKRDQKNQEKERRKQALARSKFTTPLRSNKKRRREEISDTEDDRRAPRARQKSRSRRVTSRGKYEARSLKGPTSLPLLDWRRRQMIGFPGKKSKKESERDLRAKLEIPEQMAKQGIAHRLPTWEAVNPASNVTDQSNFMEPPRGRHPDEVYASWSYKLINCLNGNARSWAIHEFFYSDIDRAWYTENPFAKEVAKLGILPTQKLTRREWSAVRRMIPGRPRRFSKRFIYSQLQERNSFRNMVRHKQRHPEETNHTGYEIPAPIKAGATVTAYNKKFLILHRGVVLFHDIYAARYLVQFERKELGFEFCSDTEVASHGLPNILMPSVPHKLGGLPYEAGVDEFSRIGTLQYGTSFGPLSVPKTKVTCDKEAAAILAKKQASNIEDDEDAEDSSRAALIEKVAERETLVTLMAIIDAATSRKAMLLNVMGKFNALLVDRLPFGEGPPPNHVISGYFEKHFAWLRANLEMTNQTLDLSLSYMKVMYGKAYSSTPEIAKVRVEKIKNMFTETVINQDRRFCGGPPAATMPWIGALHHGSRDVGSYLASLVCQESMRVINVGDTPENRSNYQHLHKRIAAAGGVLSAIGYCCGRSEEGDITLPDGDPPLVDVVLAAGLEELAMPRSTVSDKDETLREFLSDRAAAEQELKESFALLSKEFTSQSFASRLH